MNLKHCLPLCFALAANLGGCGTTQQGATGPAGLQGPEGPAGPVGAPGPVDPNLTYLIPSSTFLARTLEVQVSGSGTHFAADSTIDFGDPQITVSEITVGSNNNLRFKVQISPTAQVGAHDVTVTTGTEVAKLTGAFTVRNALQAEPVAQQPMLPQGGLYAYNLRNLDYRENPFVGDLSYSGFSPVNPSGSPARADGVALIDALTPTGLLKISVTAKSPFGADILYTTSATDAKLGTVTARTPVTLVNNTARTGETLATPFATNLYKLTTPAANQLVILTYSALGSALTSGNIKLVTAVAPASGRFSQGYRSAYTFDSTAMTGALITELKVADDYYLSTYSDDFSGAATGYTYTLTPKVVPLTAATNAEPTAETVANPSLSISSLTDAISAADGKITGSTDTDYLVFTAATTGNVLLQVVNNYVPVGGGPPYPVSATFYNDATCTAMLTSQYANAGSSATLQAAVTAGMTYCVSFGLPFTASAELPYKILLVP